jgi:hypothetical protein
MAKSPGPSREVPRTLLWVEARGSAREQNAARLSIGSCFSVLKQGNHPRGLGETSRVAVTADRTSHVRNLRDSASPAHARPSRRSGGRWARSGCGTSRAGRPSQAVTPAGRFSHEKWRVCAPRTPLRSMATVHLQPARGVLCRERGELIERKCFACRACLIRRRAKWPSGDQPLLHFACSFRDGSQRSLATAPQGRPWQDVSWQRLTVRFRRGTDRQPTVP